MKKNKANKKANRSSQNYQKIDELLSVMPIKAKPLFMDKIINAYQENLKIEEEPKKSLLMNLKAIFFYLFPQEKRALSLAILSLVIFLGVMINVNVLYQQLEVSNYLTTVFTNTTNDNSLLMAFLNNGEDSFIENEITTIITGDYYQF